MDQITFRGKQSPTGIPGVLMFEAQDRTDEIATFLREQNAYVKHKQETDPGYELFYDITLKRWYQRRTVKANNLQFELCARIAAEDHVSKEYVHSAVKEVFYPRVEYNGVFVPKDGCDLSSVEYAKVIEALVVWCVDRVDPIDIYDIYILFTDWRFGQEKDPLEGSYADKKAYKENRPLCEGCGKYLLDTDKEGTRIHLGQVAHIVSTGSGGEDKDYNWLVLCTKCHLGIQHAKGWEALLKLYEHLRPKVDRARGGKKPIEEVDDFKDDIPWKETENKELQALRDEESLPKPSPETEVEKVARVFQGVIVDKNPASDDSGGQHDEIKEDMYRRLSNLSSRQSSEQEKIEKPANSI